MAETLLQTNHSSSEYDSDSEVASATSLTGSIRGNIVVRASLLLAGCLAAAVVCGAALAWQTSTPQAPHLRNLNELDALDNALRGKGSGPTSHPGTYVTNAPKTNMFQWGAPVRTVQQAFDDAFPNGTGWQSVRFTEGSATTWTPTEIVKWVDQELVRGVDPFAAYGSGIVPVPFSAPGYAQCQLAPGQFVGYSRRQLCYIVAKSLVGCPTKKYNNGLLRFMNQTVDGTSIFVPSQAGEIPRRGGFGRAWWQQLLTCAADPALASGGQGSLILIAVSGPEDPSVKDVFRDAQTSFLSAADLRLCRYDDGSNGSLAEGIDGVPEAGCRQPTASGPGRDFMTGGLAGQAVVDITAAWLGGYINTNAAGIGGGQDERLMTYMPEVLTLAFFLSQAPGQWPQVRAPAWVLGARRLALGLDGTCRWDSLRQLNADLPLTSDITKVTLKGVEYDISASSPFLGFYSKSQDWGGNPALNRRNKDPGQRSVDPQVWYSFDLQVQAYYDAVALTNYASEVQPVIRELVKSIGTGPWGAGLWFGDSQISFLASWIAHAAARGTWDGSNLVWKGAGLPMDYYIYSAFTENPSNQCFVHAGATCQACLNRCSQNPLPQSAFWLPQDYYMNPEDRTSPCVVSQLGDCGTHGIEDIIEAYKHKRASVLWGDLTTALEKSNPDTSRSVFDILLDGSA